jgi:hypothetical protein
MAQSSFSGFLGSSVENRSDIDLLGGAAALIAARKQVAVWMKRMLRQSHPHG